VSLSEKIGAMLTRSPGSVAVEQFRKLYLRLYPYVLEDFAHKRDLDIAFVTISAELAAIKLLLQTHAHPAIGTPTPLPIPPVSPSVIPGSAIAVSLIVPGGVPQPTGAGISIQPSRIDPNPIAIPPLNPLDPSL
jgi:hypothetical protein